MRVLVTGARGFIGKHLVRRLRQTPGVRSILAMTHGVCPDRWWGPDPVGLHETYGDLTKEKSVTYTVSQYSPDVIFHLGGISLVKENRDDPTYISQVNVMGTHHLLAAAPAGCRFVFASSATVYGNHAHHYRPAFVKLTPSSVYGATKMAAEGLVEAYTALKRVRGVSLRLVACVGREATHGLIPDLLSKLKSPSPTLDLLGDEPGSRKHYLHVEDAVGAFLHIGLSRSHLTGPINIATDDILSVREVALQVMHASEMSKPIRWLGEEANWAGDNRVVSVDNSDALNVGWTPRFRSSRDAVYQAVRSCLNPEEQILDITCS